MPIIYSAQAMKEMKALAPHIRDRIEAKVEQYAENPASLANNVKSLTNSAFCRLRIGDYRVIFTLDGEEPIILIVHHVRHRRDAYD